MGSTTGLMALAMGTQAVTAVTTSQAQAAALKANSEFEQQQAKTNERMATIQSDEALNRGNLEAAAIRRRANQVKGSQRANLAAQGIDINSGSALEVQNETDLISEIDMMTAKNNAWREAWGYRVQANDIRTQSRFSSLAAKSEAEQTVLTGGLTAIGYGAQAAYYSGAFDDNSTAKTKTTSTSKTKDIHPTRNWPNGSGAAYDKSGRKRFK